MWICKKCNTENEDIYYGCKKCYTRRTYPFKFLRFFLITFALTGISVPGLILALHHSSMLLLWGIIFVYVILAMALVVDKEPKYTGVISIVISTVLGFVTIIAFGEFTFRKKFELYESTIETISYITLSVSILGIILYLVHEVKKEQTERQKLTEEIEANEKRKREEDRKKYGSPTRIIRPYGYDRHSPCVRVFSKTNIIEINGSKIKFEDIVDYHVAENVTAELHMSKPNMIRRGIVGGLLYGRVGAYVGVATADRYLQENFDYTIYIRLGSGTIRRVRTEDPVFVDDLCEVLESILYQIE